LKKGAGPLLCPIPGLLEVEVCFVMSQQNVPSTTGSTAGCGEICDVHCGSQDALLAEASRREWPELQVRRGAPSSGLLARGQIACAMEATMKSHKVQHHIS
jgi:hypothetical protein